MFTAEQAAAGACLLFFRQKCAVFKKGAFWGPQSMFTAEEVGGGVQALSFDKRHAFLKTNQFL